MQLMIQTWRQTPGGCILDGGSAEALSREMPKFQPKVITKLDYKVPKNQI